MKFVVVKLCREREREIETLIEEERVPRGHADGFNRRSPNRIEKLVLGENGVQVKLQEPSGAILLDGAAELTFELEF